MSAATCKAILNGRNTADVLRNLADSMDGYDAVEPNEKVIGMLNQAEDCAFKATRLYLDQVQYKGEYPHSLTIKI